MDAARTWRNQDERRFQLDRDAAEEVLGLLDEHLPRVVYTAGSLTTLVTTTYLDTPEGHYYRVASSGSCDRSVKIRVREYFPLDDEARRPLACRDDCFFERKERTGRVRLKQRVHVTKTRVSRIIERLAELPEPGPEAEAITSELDQYSLMPVLTSAYERRVWGSDDEELRITFDERLRFHRPPERLYTRFDELSPERIGEPFAVGPSRILEVKHRSSEVLAPWLSELLAGLTPSEDYSKFVDGMQQLRKRHRFVPSLTQPVKALK